MSVQFAISPASRDLSPASWTETSEEDGLGLGLALSFDQDCEIYGEGEEALSYYKVVSGVVRTCKFLSDGRRQIDSFHVAGDVFGIETGGEHSLSAEAVSDCKIIAYRLPADGTAFKAMSPQLVSQLLRNLSRAQNHAVLLCRRSAVEKVASFLLDWARQPSVGGMIALAMTRQDIGDYLGLTIETVSRTLSQLERDGVIELPSVRQIRVTNVEALNDLNG